ncbi:hypothetical protein PanWU01x14_355830 [Parasponia andersonii]|uniref:Uncharacterized protein n=1 Tax=Parasponia andersonii TaxID=3476 RepID=A0A2P5A948_PARAD|nr:hypothetical protein PanWU01x14_355830 [Parasponia andersonii]
MGHYFRLGMGMPCMCVRSYTQSWNINGMHLGSARVHKITGLVCQEHARGGRVWPRNKAKKHSAKEGNTWTWLEDMQGKTLRHAA